MSWLTWPFWAAVPVLIVSIWVYSVQLSQAFPTLKNKRICLLIAHPDDEAMFFSPTVLALTDPKHGNHFKIICFSTGNADGLGETRKQELVKSAMLLGLRTEDDVLVIDDANFPDSMTTTWNPRLLSNLLTTAFAPKMASIPSTSAPQTTVDILITFDDQGVSGHSNHKSLYHGAKLFVKSIMHRHSGWECPIKLYTLTSTNVVRKYIGIFDAPLTVLGALVGRKEKGEHPTPLLLVSEFGGYNTARKTMTQAHKSQMVWFRWGWISISRYMIINDLKKENTP